MEDSVPAEINTSKNANVSLTINSENITVNSAMKKSSILTAKLAKMEEGKSYIYRPAEGYILGVTDS
jgi:ABC-type ATPase with predicted acetyltransferase domain